MFFLEKCDIIRNGRVAEWLMALVLKTSRLTSRRFESCPFRHASFGAFLLKLWYTGDMGIFKFSFGKKQEAANQDANTNSGAQQWQGMAEAVPFKNEVEAREKAQMERQQRKIIASVMYDRRYLSEPDVRLPQGAKEDFDVKIRAGEISDDMEKDFLMNIQTPVGALGAEQVNDRLGNNSHFRRMLGFAALGEDGFKNYQQMMGPRAVESFARNYPTPMDFAKVSARMLKLRSRELDKP